MSEQRQNTPAHAVEFGAQTKAAGRRWSAPGHGTEGVTSIQRKRTRPPQLEDADWLREQYVEGGQTQQQIAADLGCERTMVHRALKRHDLLATRPPVEPVSVGDRFGRLVVVDSVIAGHRRVYVCICACGRTSTVRRDRLSRERTLPSS